jgi:adenylylsulfate kinase|tara:strand:+ start:1250 stop:1756 length:507 start_codon:yes stop_codon:yes gene_type:complete
MSGSGKSTLAQHVKQYFELEGYKVHIIDGDDIRDNDSQKLGFEYKDVEINNNRIAKLCLESKANGLDLVIVPVISPYQEIRRKIRKMLEPDFHLVYLETDLDELVKRDTKGLYKLARAGVIKDLIGYSENNPYEIPSNPDLVINTNKEDLLSHSKDTLLNYVKTIMLK